MVGTDKVTRAELEAAYQPNERTRYDLRIARAEADYDLAKETCDDLAGNAKDNCVAQAKTRYGQ